MKIIGKAVPEDSLICEVVGCGDPADFLVTGWEDEEDEQGYICRPCFHEENLRKLPDATTIPIDQQELDNVEGCLWGDYDFDDDCEAAAEREGCSIVYPEPNQLQIDIDTEKQYTHFQGRLFDLQGIIGHPVKVEEHFSKSGAPHMHITLTLNPHDVIDPWKRIALQFMLCSDPIRESLNTLRQLAGMENATRLFELKEKTDEA